MEEGNGYTHTRAHLRMQMEMIREGRTGREEKERHEEGNEERRKEEGKAPGEGLPSRVGERPPFKLRLDAIRARGKGEGRVRGARCSGGGLEAASGGHEAHVHTHTHTYWECE